MAEILAVNNTGSRSIVGRIVKADTRLPNAYTYTRLSDTQPLGVVVNATPHKSPSRIATSGVAPVSIVGRVKRNDTIRLAKVGDIGVSQGQCVVAKAGDAPYLKVGTAQATSSGLVPVSLEWAWVSAGTAGDELVKLNQTTQQTGLGQLFFQTAKFGTSTNYTEFEADGTIHSVGNATVWDDMRIVPGQFDRPGVSDPSIQDWQPAGSGTTFSVWCFNQGQYAFFTIQVPHSYKIGSTIYAHVHWTPRDRGTTESGNTVAWKIDYSIADINGNFPASTTVDLTDTCDGTNHKHQMSPDIALSHTASTVSAMLVGKIYRDTGDTWAGTTANAPALLELDFHFEVDTLGSRSIHAK